VPRGVERTFQHLLQTYASEVNKTVSVWRAVPDDLLDFTPHAKLSPIRTILVHQLLSEGRFFAQCAGTEEAPAEELLTAGAWPVVLAYKLVIGVQSGPTIGAHLDPPLHGQ
jgi:hypothetical protein